MNLRNCARCGGPATVEKTTMGIMRVRCAANCCEKDYGSAASWQTAQGMVAKIKQLGHGVRKGSPNVKGRETA